MSRTSVCASAGVRTIQPRSPSYATTPMRVVGRIEGDSVIGAGSTFSIILRNAATATEAA